MFNFFKRKKNDLPIYLRSEEEVERAIEAELSKMVVNGEEKRRTIRPIEDEYKMFRTYSVYHMVNMVSVEPLTIDLITVTLSENLLGDRMFTVLRNGIIDSRFLPSLAKTQEWQQHILPWLNNETDVVPTQDLTAFIECLDQVKDITKNLKRG